MKKLGLFILCVLALAFIVSTGTRSRSSTGTASAATAVVPSTGWEYSTDKDRLTDSVFTTACLKSTNRIGFAFPYESPDGSFGQVCFRNKEGKLDGYFQVSKGQLMCNFLSCPMQTRFDDGAVQTRHGLASKAGSIDIAFFSDASAVLKQLEKSHRVRVAMNYYQSGQNTFDFSPQGLDESKLVASR
jgi:hypothetical protein